MAEDTAPNAAEPILPMSPAPAPPARGTPPRANIIAAQLGRLAWLCTVASGLILAGVLAGNALLLLVGYAPTLWLIALVDIGPLIALFLGNVATILGYYGTWRILRRLDEYSVSDDAKNQLLQVPGMAQDIPRALSRRLGCVHVVTLGTLAVSLVVTGLTLAPTPLQALGVAVVVTTPTPTPTMLPTATATPPPTPTATAPSTLSLLVNPTNAQQQCAADGTLQPLTVTLDNTGSTVDEGWSVTIGDTVPNTTLAWATANPAAGTVAAGTTGTFDLVPSGRLCYAEKQLASFTAIVAFNDSTLAPVTVTDTIIPLGTPIP